MITKVYDELKAKFSSIYANLPEPEKVQVIAVINERTYSWDKAYNEISNDTDLGMKILEKMQLVGIL